MIEIIATSIWVVLNLWMLSAIIIWGIARDKYGYSSIMIDESKYGKFKTNSFLGFATVTLLKGPLVGRWHKAQVKLDGGRWENRFIESYETMIDEINSEELFSDEYKTDQAVRIKARIQTIKDSM